MPKPPVHIRFDEISCVNFARVQSGGGTSGRSFDFEVEHKNSSVITFSSIDKYVCMTTYDKYDKYDLQDAVLYIIVIRQFTSTLFTRV